MSEANETNGGSSKALFWGVFLLIVGIGAGASFLYKDAEQSRSALDGAKRDYEEMQQLKKVVAKGKSLNKKLPNPREASEDILPFLERKRAAAGIPQNLFAVARNTPTKAGGWTETSYTITLRGTKESPVSRDSVADFLVAVETERPSIKSKNLNLSFVPSSRDLLSATITLSQFQRD